MNSGGLCRLLMFHGCEARLWSRYKSEAAPRGMRGHKAVLKRGDRLGQDATSNEPELMNKGLAQAPLPQLITER
jgi:hypothetical protein